MQRWLAFCMFFAVVGWWCPPQEATAVEVTGDLNLAAFTADVMSTTRARLEKGSVRFELTQSAVDHYLHVEGLWIWDVQRDYFRGTVERQRPKSGQEPQNRSAPGGEVIWFRTAGEECLYDAGRRYASRRSPPGRSTSINFPTRPFLDAFYAQPHRLDFLLLERGCVPTERTSVFRITKDADGRTVIDKESASIGYRSQRVADPKQGGHIVEWWGQPPAGEQWYRGLVRWQEHAGGTWFPAVYEYRAYPPGSFEKSEYEVQMTFRDFDPAPTISPQLFSFAALKLPVGTRVIVTTGAGTQIYDVGGASGERANFEAQLRRSAELLQSQGFADPQRSKQP